MPVSCTQCRNFVHYAGCRYAGYRHAGCHGAIERDNKTVFVFSHHPHTKLLNPAKAINNRVKEIDTKLRSQNLIYGFQNKLECLSLNTRLSWKGLPGTNTLAFSGNGKLRFYDTGSRPQWLQT